MEKKPSSLIVMVLQYTKNQRFNFFTIQRYRELQDPMDTSINEGFFNNSQIVSTSYVKITGLSPKTITKFRDYRCKKVKKK